MTDQEYVGLRNAIATISADYPEMSPAEIAGLVRAEHAKYEGRPVRDFVPVLVERAVRQQLRGRGLARAS